MSLNIGTLTAYLTTDNTGLTRGLTQAETAMDRTGQSGQRSGSMIGKAMKGAAVALGGLGLAKVGSDAVSLEATFSKTMAQVQASTGASGAEMAKMSKLAMKMGADTAFSASDASDAMLELAKAGVSTSDIMGGALQGTLTLAAAGGTDMGTAATIASNAMNTFNLRGKDMNSIAAALAGGANASSASVESLGQALQQVGPGAKNAGLSLQETVGTLAAFDNAGIKGSDAGTSLKTMLTMLQPATTRQAKAMQEVGLWTAKGGSAFVKANGQFKSMAQISQLLHDKLGGLSQAQKSQALTQIFGSDASRAATVLMNEGAKGIGKYIKATKDQGAAQKMAAANMSGTSGAIEKMKGAIETAELAIGQALAPAIQFLTGLVATLAGGIATLTTWLDKHKAAALALVGVVTALTAVTMTYAAVQAVAAAGGMLQFIKGLKLVQSAMKVATAVQWAYNAAVSANPLMLIVIAVAAVVAAIVLVATKTKWGHDIMVAAWNGIKATVQAVGSFFSATLPGFFTGAWDKIKGATTGGVSKVVGWVRDIPGKLKNALSNLSSTVKNLFSDAMKAGKDKVTGIGGDIVSWFTSIPGKIASKANLGSFAKAGRQLIGQVVDGMKNAAGIISGIAGNVWTAVKGLLNGAIDKINAALDFKISLPGPDVHVNLPDIRHLKTGGRVGANNPQMAWIGDANEPESVLRDSQLQTLLRAAVSEAMSSLRPTAAAPAGPLVGQVVQQPGESAGALAERLWFLTRTRG